MEDIIDTGATLLAVRAKLLELGAASVKSAVLLNKFERREAAIEPDYWALKVTPFSLQCIYICSCLARHAICQNVRHLSV